MIDTLISLLPGLALVPLTAALALLIWQRYRAPAACAHSGWLDMPDTRGMGPSVHSRVVQGYEELEKQRDLAQAELGASEQLSAGEALEWALTTAELTAELDACRRQLTIADGRIVDQWEDIEELEREIRAGRDAEEGMREALWDAWQQDC